MKRTLHAGRVLVSIAGKVVGRMTGVNPTQSFGLTPQHEIGTIYPYEHVPLRFTGSVTCSRFMVEQQVLRDLGVVSGSDDTEIEDAFRALMAAEGIDISVIEKESGEVIYTFPGCKCDTFGVAITANAVIMTNMTFQFGSQGPMRSNPAPESQNSYTIEIPQQG